MTKISNFLINSRNISSSAALWNAVSAMLNSLQTMLLLMVITRFGTMEDSSVFVMAYAVGNLMLNVGKYGIRQFQVTDIKEKYSFEEYLKARKISVAVMLILSVVYTVYGFAFNSYNTEKCVMVLLICMLRAVEAYEDVYHGLFQQKGRLDIASKVLGIRMAVFIVGCAVLYVVTRNLLVTVALNLAVTLLLSIMLNKISLKGINFTSACEKSGRFSHLLSECLPLCVCLCLNVYIANAPKYIIDSAVDAETQTYFNIIFMPVFVIALLASFIFQPILKNMGEIWTSSDKNAFVKRILRLSLLVVIGCIAVTAVGALIGAEVLGFVYKVSLDEYRNLLILFMLAGGIIALQNLFIMAITVVRYQKYMIYGYILTALIILIPGKNILKVFGLEGMSLYFVFSMLLLLIYCIILTAIAVKKSKRKDYV